MTERQPRSRGSALSAHNDKKAPTSHSSAPSSKPPSRRNMPGDDSKKTETPLNRTPDTGMSAASRPRWGKQPQETTSALERLAPIKRKPVPIARDVPEIEGLQLPAQPHSHNDNGGFVYRSHPPAHAALAFGFDPEPLPVSRTWAMTNDDNPSQSVNSAPHRPAHAALAFGFDPEPLPASHTRVVTNDTPESIVLPPEVIQARRTLHELAFADGPWAASAKLPLPLDEVERAQKALYDDAFPEGWPKHPEELKEPRRGSGNEAKETRQVAAGGNAAKEAKGKAAAVAKPVVQRKPVPPVKTTPRATQSGGREAATPRTVIPKTAAAPRETDKPEPSNSVARKPIATRTVADKPGAGHMTVTTNRAQSSQTPRSGGTPAARQTPSSAKAGARTGPLPSRTPARGGPPTEPVATTITTTATTRRASAQSTPPSGPTARSVSTAGQAPPARATKFRTTVRTPATSSKASTTATGSAPKPRALAVAAAMVATKADTDQPSATRAFFSKGGKKAPAGKGADNEGESSRTNEG